jgi:hypothetical protein
MLSNIINITPSANLFTGTGGYTYDLVSREGMDSVRVQTSPTTQSALAGKLIVKNTMGKGKSPNRHLISFQALEPVTINGVDSNEMVTVNFSITRSKLASDDFVADTVAQAVGYLGNLEDLSQHLRGGN